MYHHKSTQAFSRYPKASMNPKKILVVDDYIDNLVLLQILLKRMNAEITIRNNGWDATKLIVDSKFDLIIMDIQMPQMDGYEAAQKIRQLGCITPIIALTANYDTKKDPRYCMSGFNHCLFKPIFYDDLKYAVDFYCD